MLSLLFWHLLPISLSDRLVPSLDTIVPFDSAKAYDMLDIIQTVCAQTCAFYNILISACSQIFQSPIFRSRMRRSFLKLCPTTPKTLWWDLPVWMDALWGFWVISPKWPRVSEISIIDLNMWRTHLDFAVHFYPVCQVVWTSTPQWRELALFASVMLSTFPSSRLWMCQVFCQVD